MFDYIADIPKVHTALAEWSACIIYVILLEKRFKLNDWRFWIISALSLMFFVGLHIGLEYLHFYFLVPGIIVAITAIWSTLYFLGKLRITDAIFWTARAFILAEFMASFEWQIYFYLTQTFSPLSSSIFQYSILAVVYMGILSGVYFLERRYVLGNLHSDIRVKESLLSAGMAIGMFLLSNFSFILPGSPFSGQFPSEIFYIRTLVGLCALILLFSQQEQRRWRYNNTELVSVRKILSHQYEQYRISKDNMEYLNRKYHDFKQQIEVIQIETNPQKRDKYLNDLKKAIKIYEAQSHSGNIVLDTLITSKSRRCVENNINFTYVADGKLLKFMDTADICSIVGNALDNAIESVSKLDNPQKSLVKMAIYSQNGSVVLRFENYYEGQLRFDKELPSTTKGNTVDHGYGLKSIKYSAEKYGGSIDISVNDNWFILCIIIPLETAKKDN